MRKILVLVSMIAFGAGAAYYFTCRPECSNAERGLKGEIKRVADGNAGPDLLSRLQAIWNEGARFNIGKIYRNFNDPTFALLILDPGTQPRFKFHLDGKEKIGDTEAVRISFSEQKRPTLVRDGSKDAPASGTLWVTPSDGAVLRTHVTFVLKDANGGSVVQTPIDLNADIEVDYQRDAGMESWMPTQMRERYRLSIAHKGASPLVGSTLEIIDTIRCTATYSNFRKFQTAAHLVPDP